MNLRCTSIPRPGLFAWTLGIALLVGLLIAAGPGTARAHDAMISHAMALGDIGTYQHDDEDPFKGWLELHVTNTGTAAWGDFHFEIYEVEGFGSVENVHWLVDAPNAPTSSQGGLSWNVYNESVGAVLDLTFYGDPVGPGQTAWFKVYTDNQDHLDFFVTSFHPTPVPVPGALWLLGTGLLGMAGWVRRSRG